MRFGRLMSNVLGLAILLPSVLVAQEPPRGSSDRTNWFNSLDKNGDGRLSPSGQNTRTMGKLFGNLVLST